MNQTEENFRRIRNYNLKESACINRNRMIHLLNTLAAAVNDSKGTWKTINGAHVKIDENTNEIIAGPPALKE